MEIIVAANADWGIGLRGSQSIVIPEDRRRFRELTTGNAIIAGRRTFADFPGSTRLPDRLNIILSRDSTFAPEGVMTVRSLPELAITLRDITPERVFIVGGAAVYVLLLPYCTRAHVTRIQAAPESDAFFPNLDALPGWVLRTRSPARQHGDIAYTFDTYDNSAPADICEV